MTWSLQHRDNEWDVVNDEDESVAGSHPSRVDAIKHQRRLYASEARVASMYAEMDSRPEPEVVVSPPQESKSELVKIEIGDQALTAAIVRKMDAMAERQSLTEQALVAALHAIGTRDSVVNVQPASVTVEPSFTVEAPNVTVEAPTVNVEAPQVTIESPTVTVEMPERSKTVTFERDPLTQQVTKAEVVET